MLEGIQSHLLLQPKLYKWERYFRTNQNHLQPGTMLTSMVKSVGLAAYKSWDDAAKGSWKPGIQSLGLAEGGVDWALDENNAALITPEMKAAADDAKAKIIAGEITVHDFTTDGKCPAF